MRAQFYLKSHSFSDNTSRIQLFNKGEEHEFIDFESENFKTTPFSALPDSFKPLMRAFYHLSDTQMIQERSAYNTMDLLEAIGGIFASMAFIGYIFHSMISQNEKA